MYKYVLVNCDLPATRSGIDDRLSVLLSTKTRILSSSMTFRFISKITFDICDVKNTKTLMSSFFCRRKAVAK